MRIYGHSCSWEVVRALFKTVSGRLLYILLAEKVLSPQEQEEVEKVALGRVGGV